MDTYGSRSLAVGGMAVLQAAEKVVEKAKVIAAHMLEAGPDDLEFKDGAFSVKGDPRRPKTIQEVALARRSPRTTCPTASSRSCDAEATVDPDDFSFPHGTHLCAVEVDTETGHGRRSASTSCVDDVGKVVNPMIVEGQVHGGLAQGIAQALYEEAVYDDDGNLVTGVVRRLPGARRARPADLRHRPHRDARRPTQPAGRQGRRRGRHDRLDSGGGQRDRRRAPRTSGVTRHR